LPQRVGGGKTHRFFTIERVIAGDRLVRSKKWLAGCRDEFNH
jgi:hypothetical protein